MCDSSILRPLSIILKNFLQGGSFRNNWKKSNVVPIHEKGDKQLLQTIGLFLCCQYVVKFLRELFSILSLNISEAIIFSVQIRFYLFDWCENQLLSIVQDIYNNFDQHPTLEVRANFLDVSKSFDKVLKPLIKYYMKGYYSNLSVLESIVKN